MEREYLIGIVLALAALGVGVGAVLFAGGGPAPGGDGPGTTSAFSYKVDSIEECGQTCQDVTITLANNQTDAASQTTLHMRIFAGRNNTADDDLVWEDTVDVGTLEAGGSYTTTKRVEFSFQEGMKITDEDGWITIHTTVESGDTKLTFERSTQISITAVMPGSEDNSTTRDST